MLTKEPVLGNGTAATIAAAVTPILIYAGVQSDQAGRVGSYVGAGLAIILAVWHLFSARSKVTPLAKLEAVEAALNPAADAPASSTQDPAPEPLPDPAPLPAPGDVAV